MIFLTAESYLQLKSLTCTYLCRIQQGKINSSTVENCGKSTVKKGQML
jgi:hypothetical protein